ncbi:FliH/SctL family protein [Planctomicrobium sp. SH668]|uniref:FliH/SctL family protein n=1 Tax=Planctomicrobium sp. SH668 TaxID=3448126 RepID=UPI003F5C830A
MFRKQITFSSSPTQVFIRSSAAEQLVEASPEPVSKKPAFPHADVEQTTFPSQPPPPDLQPLLETISEKLNVLDQRRHQSLAEMQQVALELAVAVASHLVFEAISSDQFGVEQLVQQAIAGMEIDGVPIVWLHPLDLELLNQRLRNSSVKWNPEKVHLRSDPSLSRGGCRVKGTDGRLQVSDISLRLSEIRRHWLEELDDTQTERRSTQEEGQKLRRFPDRRKYS